MRFLHIPTACLALALSGIANAQTRFDLSISGANFASAESNSYLDYSLRYSLHSTLDATFRGADGKRQTFVGTNFNLIHGGDDRELIFTYRPSHLSKLDVGLGAAVPGTPERHNPLVGTYDIGWTETGSDNNSIRVSARGIVTTNPIAAGFAKGTFAIKNCPTDFIAEIGLPFVGNNDRSTTDGTLRRSILGSVGFQINQRNRDAGFHASLRLTNELGETTGMSLTPSLGSRYGLVLSVGVRF